VERRHRWLARTCERSRPRRNLAASEVAQIESALQQVAAEFLNGTFEFVDGEEDIHTSIERRITQIAGAVGGKVHTGRSRNDQCVTALRLWTKRELAVLAERLIALCEVLTQRADLGRLGHRRRVSAWIHARATCTASATCASPHGARVGIYS
jgi:hypothetical protein